MRVAERQCVLQAHTTGELTGRGVPRLRGGYARARPCHRHRQDVFTEICCPTHETLINISYTFAVASDSPLTAGYVSYKPR